MWLKYKKIKIPNLLFYVDITSKLGKYLAFLYWIFEFKENIKYKKSKDSFLTLYHALNNSIRQPEGKKVFQTVSKKDELQIRTYFLRIELD